MSFYYFYILFLLVGIGISVYLIARLWSIRKTPGAYSLIWGVASVLIWSFAYCFEIMIDSLPLKLAWSKTEYLGIPFVAVAIFSFTLFYTGRTRWHTPGNFALLMLIPVATAFLAFTNDWHHFLWSKVSLSGGEALGPLLVGHGPWYNVNILYSYFLLILATVFLAQVAVQNHNLYRAQTSLMLAGMLVPWLANLVYILRLGPAPSLDWTPLALTVTMVALEVGFARYRLMDIQPIALSAVFNALQDGVVVTDARGRVVDLNPAAKSIFDLDGEHCIGKPVSALLPGWEQPHVDIPDREGINQEVRLGSPPGERHYSVRMAPIRDRHNQVTGALAILTDITERKRGDEQLKQAHQSALEANRMKTQLLASISHDLRTPLGAITGYTEMLQSGVFGPLNPGQMDATSEVLDSANQLLAFVNNLIGQAQIETGRLVLKEGEFEPAELVESVFSIVGYMAKKKGLELGSEIDSQLPEELRGDEYWLRQILLNLVNNAVKFTDKGSVTVRFCHPDRDHWSLQVSDTGCGIPPESRQAIFEPFQQGNGDNIRRRSGSGLGLSIVKQLTALMGGSIELQSEVGQGSTFTVLLPLIDD